MHRLVVACCGDLVNHISRYVLRTVHTYKPTCHNRRGSEPDSPNQKGSLGIQTPLPPRSIDSACMGPCTTHHLTSTIGDLQLRLSWHSSIHGK